MKSVLIAAGLGLLCLLVTLLIVAVGLMVAFKAFGRSRSDHQYRQGSGGLQGILTKLLSGRRHGGHYGGHRPYSHARRDSSSGAWKKIDSSDDKWRKF